MSFPKQSIHNDIHSQRSIVPGLAWNPWFFWINVRNACIVQHQWYAASFMAPASRRGLMEFTWAVIEILPYYHSVYMKGVMDYGKNRKID
ncbi:MAG: hypothetical protein DWB56_15640 [Candidatus Jettenia sp.]|uniref:hypothetical protein n=1 Tax=Candidatus Jettenia sp. AMX1 TaxID=2293637 RepID=UPI00058F6D34|nr:hypothetical protein [Candidatus Jettenia sp. AMX1]MBC6930363.1 hypothetical protein [Candidatus Jettenia sp.]MDL1940367.1 hypothetical protein [Candidatus Jettenia sp. AMX1]NUN23116.1 hypothetical protein [Candidatus Jettenia caeni]